MNPMERFRSNMKVACKLRIKSDVWFSEDLADCCRDSAPYYQVGNHTMALAVINGGATTCRSTYVNRSTHFLAPYSLFNLVTGSSGEY